MQLLNRQQLTTKLEEHGVQIEFSEAREGFLGTPVNSSTSYHLLPTVDGWRAFSTTPNGSKELLFEGSSRDEAVFACLAMDAREKHVVEPLKFTHTESGVALRNSNLLAPGLYRDPSGAEIEITAGADRYLLRAADGSLVGAFSNANIAISLAGVAALPESATLKHAAAEPATEPPSRQALDATKFTLQVSKIPELRHGPSGFAQMTLEGVLSENGRTTKVNFVGDRAKAMHLILQSRKPSDDNPVIVSIDGRLKTRQFHDYKTGQMRLKMQFEAVSSEVLPSSRRAPTEKTQDALCA